jgi:hypothetical protein
MTRAEIEKLPVGALVRCAGGNLVLIVDKIGPTWAPVTFVKPAVNDEIYLMPISNSIFKGAKRIA